MDVKILLFHLDRHSDPPFYTRLRRSKPMSQYLVNYPK